MKNFEENNLSKIKLYEDFEDNYTFECSGSPSPYFSTKSEFFEFMEKNGFKHSTLNKNTNMLIVAYEDIGTLKFQKAKKYGIPIFTYGEAKQKIKNLINAISKFKL